MVLYENEYIHFQIRASLGLPSRPAMEFRG
jgi:hypothetical protein